jgi:two-component system, LytTR family, response regulator
MSGPRITALIVDDEPPARRKIRRFLEEDEEITIVGEVGTGEKAVEMIRSLSPDVVFLDIQMPGIDGFGVVEALGSGTLPEIIFVTAHDEHALRAFEVAALDYLLKPFDRERFARALTRAKGRVGEGSSDLAARIREIVAKVENRTASARRILVKTRDRSVLVKVEDITWIRAAGNYVEIHAGEATYLLRETLDGMGRQLDPDTFLRVHRSFLVNADAIQEIQPWSHGDHVIRMRDGARIRLSRRYRDRLPQLLRENL